MTDLRTAAQQALESLEKATRFMSDSDYKKLNETIEILSAALAEPVQEPVAWMFVDDTGMKFVSVERPHKHCQPLYTAPPQRKPPATIDEIFDRMNKAPKGVFYGHDPMTIWMEAWRAAEQHGIKDD